jgi:hypothetical protein
MRISAKRAIALPVAALSAVALAGFAAGTANADVVSGSLTLTVNASFLAGLAQHGIGFVPSGYSSLSYADGAATVTYALSAGSAEVSTYSGDAPVDGGIFGFDLKSLKLVDLQSLIFDLGDSQFDGQGSAAVGEVPLLDITGTTFGAKSGTAEVYSGSELTLDPAGAAYLDSALGTSAFTAGTQVGSFTASWTAS